VIAQNPEPYELIIAVDHNKDLLEILKQELPHTIKIVLNDGARGLSETRNVGIRAATGDIIAFIDDDAVAEKDWLIHLITPFQDERVVAVGGRAIPLWHNGGRPAWFPEELDWIVGCTYLGLPVKGTQIRNVPGCNMAFKYYIFHQVGFFRSEIGRTGKTMGVAEESELCIRIKQKVSQSMVVYEPRACIYHKVPPWRLNSRYLVVRSYNEGFYKRIVKKLLSEYSRQRLSTENSYLHYLLFTAIPKRLRYFYKMDTLFQTGAIMASIVAAGLGYLMGNLKQV